MGDRTTHPHFQAVVAALLVILNVAGIAAAQSGPTIKVAAPSPAKAMVEELIAEFIAKGGITAAIDYARVDSNTAAAGGLVGGRDMALTIGKIADKDLGFNRDGWKKLAAQEHILGGRALAVVVHPRNNVETLSVDQLRSIFSAKEREWKVFGGEAKPIRRYGLGSADPLQLLFNEKILPPAKCGVLQRKKDSAESLAMLAGDPQAIAFIDAVAAISAGDAVKVLSIGDGHGEAVYPNARTIKDGSYSLAQPLVLYVSPRAADPAPAFSRFLLSGDGDAIVRKHGFMPTVRPVKADLAAAFQKLYGAEIKRVKATADTGDDIALANQMIDSARKIKLDEAMVAALCASAYDLAFPVAGQEIAAYEAIAVLRQKAPEQAMECHLLAAALYERSYQSDKSAAGRADGEHLIGKLMAAADAGTAAGQFAKAAEAWRHALAAAEELSSPRLAALKERLAAFAAREQTLKQLEELSPRLPGSSRDPALRRQLFLLHLIELDQPAEAMRFLDAAGDEACKTNVPLACEKVEKLSEDSALTLAEWYSGLADKAQTGGRELMARRGLRYYLWFFELHKDREDALATRAALGIRKVGGEPPPAPTTKSARPIPPRPAANTTDLSLAEYVGGHLSATILSGQQIGSARLLTTLRPLSRLQKLTILEIRGAENIKELPNLGLAGLTNLTVTGLTTDRIDAVAALASLTTLDLSGARNLTDVSPIGRLGRLQILNLSGCDELADLRPLSQLAELTSLNLSGCQGVVDLKPLEKLSAKLTTLNLRGCPKITDPSAISRLRHLKSLDVRDCPGITAEAVDSLRQDLPNCKILASTPAKPAPQPVP